MIITVLTTDSVPLMGGIADYLHGLMSASIEDVDWILRTSAPGLNEDDQALPYPVHRFRITSRLLGERYGDGFKPLRRLNSLRWHRAKKKAGDILVREAVSRDHPDIIVIGRWCEDAHWWCSACRKMHQPYIIMAYGLELTMRVSSSLEQARKEDFSQAGVVFADSKRVAGLAEALTGELAPVFVLNPGIIPRQLKVLSEEELDSESRRMGLSGKFILAMGRLVHRKGFDLAVEAFDRIAEDWPGVDLVIAGDGDHRREVHAAVEDSKSKDRIRMLGRVSNREKHALLQKCEFYVMPNRPVEGDIEGFGIVFLEANMYGKAVIGGNNGGVSDAVLHEETGLLVDTPDTVALSEAMVRFLRERDFTRSCGNTGRERVLKEFLWSNLSRGFLRRIMEYC